MLNNSAVSAQVVLSREKTGSRADVTLHARGEKFLHGAGRGENFGAAMRAAVEKLANQAQTVKGKWQERKRSAASVRTMPPAAPGRAPRSRKRA